MLKNLLLKNFRSHEKLDMEFHPGVNVIWGLPGSGKTNIIRGIDWVVTDKPKYEKVHSHFAKEKDKETSVEMVFDDGRVKLTKTPSTNEYSSDKSGSFSFTNQSVPTPIAHFLNINEINIGKQLDSHFLITATPGDAGQTINRITKIEKMDEWISKLTTKSNKTKWGFESLEAECETLEKELRQYDGLDELENQINEYTEICDTGSKLDQDIRYLESSISEMNTLLTNIQKLSSLNLETDLLELVMMVQQHKDEDAEYLYLEKAVPLYRSILIKKNNADKLISEINLDGLEEMIQKTDEESIQLLQEFISTEASFRMKSNEHAEKKKQYIQLIERLGVCPICQNKISPKHIKELEADL